MERIQFEETDDIITLDTRMAGIIGRTFIEVSEVEEVKEDLLERAREKRIEAEDYREAEPSAMRDAMLKPLASAERLLGTAARELTVFTGASELTDENIASFTEENQKMFITDENIASFTEENQSTPDEEFEAFLRDLNGGEV